MSKQTNKQSFLSKLSPKSFKEGASFSKNQLVAYVAVFAAIGGIILFRSFAAGTVVATVQAEKMTLPPGATVIQDSVASAGQAVKVTTNTELKSSVAIPNGASSLSVIARGSNCYGGWPWFSLRIDGKVVLPSTKVASTGWKSFSANNTINAGTHTLSINTSNNGYVNRGCSRHLDLDLITFFGSTAPPTNVPTIALSASPSNINAGNSSTLTWSTTNATACTASGGWSGARATSGTVSTGALNATANYSLICTGPGGSANASATVLVNANTPPPPPPPTIPPGPIPPPPIGGGGTIPPGYTCNGPVNGLRIVGTGHGNGSAPAVINLASGCTGSLSFDIQVDGSGDDCVKVQGGAHDLNIGPSRCVCTTNSTGNHQDGVQVQGGSNVTFHNLTIICPHVDGQGAGGFYINGADFPNISNVICDGCNLEHTHGAVTYNAGSGANLPVNSGARNSILHYNPIWHDYAHVYGSSNPAGFLNQNNTNAPACDGTPASPC